MLCDHQLSLYDSGSSVGQQILGMQYGQTGQTAGVQGKGGNGRISISGREKILYALLVVVCPWLRDRVSTLLKYLHLTQFQDQVCHLNNINNTFFKYRKNQKIHEQVFIL